MLTVPLSDAEPVAGFPRLTGLGMPFRWVCIEGAAAGAKRAALPLIRQKLLDHFAVVSSFGDIEAGREVAEVLVDQVEGVSLPGAVVDTTAGAVNLRELALSDVPPSAQFGLFLADRVLQTQKVEQLLRSNAMVIQDRGAFSTFVYQCLVGGVSPSLFESVTRSLAPERPDLTIILAPPPGSCASAVERAYTNPPMHILKVCTKHFAMIATTGLTPDQVAVRIVEAMAGATLILPT